MPWRRRPEEREQRAGARQGPQARSAAHAAPCGASATAPATTATASAAADPQSVPAAAAPAPAAPAAPAPPVPSAGDAHAAPDRGPPGDDDPSSRDPTAAQEHTHQPPLQRGRGDARSSALAASPEPAETCGGTPEIPRPSRVPAAHAWPRPQQLQPAPSASSSGPVEGPAPAPGARPFLLGSFR